MAQIVFDASAVIALIRREPGAELIETRLGGAAMSAVNYQEVLKELIEQGFDPEGGRATVSALDIEIVPHTQDDALVAARLAPQTRKFGRGLGDRSCMALAISLGVPALTADRSWSKLEISGLEVVLIR